MDYIKKYLDNTQKFNELFELYNEWNSKINISAIRDEKSIILKHFVDSLLWNEVFNF